MSGVNSEKLQLKEEAEMLGSAKRCRILVVDDEITTVQIITEILKKKHEVIIARDGGEGVRLCKEVNPDLVLMDVMMPNMDGYAACRAIRSESDFEDLPIIFLTAADNQQSELLGLEAGGIDYLIKPVNPVLLNMRVNNHLELKKKSDLVKAQRDLLAVQKAKLQDALDRLDCLEGIIPICMYCKNIRTDEDSWERLEEYIERHSDARFSHGICDDCKAVYFLKPGKED